MGCLEQAGVFLGEVSRRNPFNVKGNQESGRVVALHDRVLKANGGSWDRPPGEVKWTDEFRAERDRIIADYAGQAECWGFKDPRALLVIDGWLEVLPASSFVGTFRHPVAVAQSLYGRGQWPLERAVELWLQYNRILRRLVEAHGVPLVSFDLPPKQYQAKVDELSRRLKLPTLRGPVDFFEDGLRKKLELPEGHGLPAEVEELYEWLNGAAL